MIKASVREEKPGQRAGVDTVWYTELEKQAEFSGGMQGLGQFLSSNLHYPLTVQKASVQRAHYVMMKY